VIEEQHVYDVHDFDKWCFWEREERRQRTRATSQPLKRDTTDSPQRIPLTPQGIAFETQTQNNDDNNVSQQSVNTLVPTQQAFTSQHTSTPNDCSERWTDSQIERLFQSSGESFYGFS
jgi:hypothetical protein